MSKQRPSLPTLLLILICLAAPGVFAQSDSDLSLLDAKQYARLNDTAREHYDVGLKMLDVVDSKLATEAFERASQAQPGHLDLAFLVADLAKDYARRTYGAESDQFYQMSLGAIERISRRSDLDMLTQARVERLEQMIQREARDRELRDGRRMEVGMAINLQVVSQLGLDSSVLQGAPRRSNTDPRAPFNVRSLSGAGAGPAGVGLGPNPFAAPAAGAAGGLSPFASGGAPAAGGSPFGAGSPAAAGGSPFGGGAPAAAGGSPFGGGAPAAAGGSPFGGGAPAAAGGSPFGAAPAATDAAAAAGGQNPFGN
jgi:hypothetical protein